MCIQRCQSAVRKRRKIKITVKILQGHCTRLILHRGLGKKTFLQRLAWTHQGTIRCKIAKPLMMLSAPQPPAPAWDHTHQDPGNTQTNEHSIPSCTALKTLSQKRMKNSKAPETTKLVISSTQVCLTLICYYCTSWTMEALPCCQTWKPHIRESQSFSKIILWEAEGLWNYSFEIFPTVQKT